VAGYDARLQFIHESDGLRVIQETATSDFPGTFNVAGGGIISLSQAIRLAGRVAMPIPPVAIGLAGRAMIRAGFADFSPEQVRFLTYGRGMDTSRMLETLKIKPEYTTREAFESFVSARGLNSLLAPDRVKATEEALTSVLTRGAARG
jgi:UDP-glucose 4-epimerase